MNPLIDSKLKFELDDFHIRKTGFGTAEKYKTTVRFRNDELESFSINVDEETANEILKLIVPDLAFSVQTLISDMSELIKHQIGQ